MIDHLHAVFVFLFGLVFGSFFNVVIARLPEGQSIVSPGSRCPHCGHELQWFENIPVLSYLALRARCRSCKAPISARYVVVELLTGLLFYACYARFGWEWQLLPALVLVCFLVPLTFIDATQWILPFELTIPGIVCGVLLALRGGHDGIEAALLGVAVGFLTFRAVEWFGWLAFRKEAMGGGDKFLVAMICAYLGARAMLGLFLLSALQGSIWGLLALAVKGRAGPEAEGTPGGKEPAPPTMTWEFAKPGLPLWKRLVLFPLNVLFQPIPDDPKDEEGNEVDWAPEATNLPYGPWLSLAALELMLLGPWLAQSVPGAGWVFVI